MSNATGRLGGVDGGDGTRSSIGDSPTLIGLNIQWSSFSLSLSLFTRRHHGIGQESTTPQGKY